MGLNVQTAQKSDFRAIRKLFLSAFPAEERPPFFLLRLKAKKSDMLAIRDGDDFVGFAYLICNRDLRYLFFFAITPEKRNMGYGTAVLELLKKRYQGERLFLAREQLDPTADNYEERIKRRQFYLQAGFSDLNCKITEMGVTFDVMSIGCTVSAEDYRLLMSSWTGKFLFRLFSMYLTE